MVCGQLGKRKVCDLAGRPAFPAGPCAGRISPGPGLSRERHILALPKRGRVRFMRLGTAPQACFLGTEICGHRGTEDARGRADTDSQVRKYSVSSPRRTQGFTETGNLSFLLVCGSIAQSRRGRDDLPGKICSRGMRWV